MDLSIKSPKIVALIFIFLAILFNFENCSKDDEIVQPTDQFDPPTNLHASVFVNAVKLTWNASPFATTPEFSHYRITIAGLRTTRIDSTQNDSITIAGITNGMKYKFTVQTVDQNKNLSSGISITLDSIATQLLPPANLQVTQQAGAIKLNWENSPFISSGQFAYYLITTSAIGFRRLDTTQLNFLTLSGLNDTTLYTFSIQTARTDGSTSTEVSTTWSAAINPPGQLAPVSNLRALSLDGAVKLFWNASPSALDYTFKRYRILTSGATTRKDSTIRDTITIPGLVNNSIDTFTVFTVKNNGVLSTAVKIVWGPVKRYYQRRVWESDSPHAGGLDFSTGDTLQLSTGGSKSDNRPYVDLWIDGHGGSTCVIKSPNQHQTSLGWRSTLFAQVSGRGLDQYVPVPTRSAIIYPSVAISADLVYFAITADSNYVRFVTTGIQGTPPNRYVDINISFDANTANPWAKR